MSTERKEKVAKRKAERQSKKTSPEVEYPSTHSENGRVLDAATVTADSNLDPLTGQAVVQNPAGIADRQTRPVGYPLPKLEPITAKAEVQNPAGLSETNDGRLPSLPEIKGQAVVQNPSGLAGAKEKPMTLSDYLAEQRANLQKDKTDAAKMQKYYALTDVFKALGQLGGTAVGGAIGKGNMLDSAPAVDPYKESRGYLDAIERAKSANEKLRALDEKEFNLAYSKQERDEERAYAEKQKAEQRAHEAEQKAEERAYKAKMEEEERKFQKEMADYKAKIEQAATEGNLRLKAQLEAQAAEKEYAHEAAMKELSLEITRMQMSGKNSGGSSKSNEKSKSVIFNDKTKMDIPDSAYDAIVDALMDSEINGEYVDKDNVKRIIRDNPKLIKEYMTILGYGDEGSAVANEVGGGYYYNPYTDTSMKSPIPSNVGDYQHANGVNAEEFDKEFSQFEE